MPEIISKSSDTFSIKKLYVFIFLAVVCLLFAGSIIATYFGKPDNRTFNQSISSTTVSPLNISTTSKQVRLNYRLPADLKPYLYDLKIKPYIGPNYGSLSFTFEGNMSMYFSCVQSTNKIIFHMNELSIDESNVKLIDLENGNLLSFKQPFEFDPELLFVTINLNTNLNKNRSYSLQVPFNGNISSRLYGFYKGSYTVAGKTYYLASTDFEPTDARSAFPCFDEPSMKAKFKLTMIRPNEMNTMSNSPLLNTSLDPANPGWSIDTFGETLPMSTYLINYVVSNFEKKTKQTAVKNITIEVAGRPEAIRNGDADFGLDEAAKIIDFFSDYFNTPYPLSKSTQVAIPNFNSGAMENWGIVNYRESSLLYNNKTDTISNKQRVSEVVSHELAHQWFGNLVTMAWWNDLWLNEGFASWVEYLGYNYTHPEWKQLDYFFIDTIPVLVKDSYQTSHPISVSVNDPKQIGSLFDSISYDKGSSIIRMMNAFLTENTFKKGVSVYLNNNKYGNAAQDDLWHALTVQSHLDDTLAKTLTVKQIMDTWTLQKGYPVVQVNRDIEGNKLIITQKWFLLNFQSKLLNNPVEYNSYKWYVPFTFTTKNQSSFNFESKTDWLKPNDTQLIINVPDQSSWVIANIKHAGYYRVNYDTNNWNELIKQLTNDHEAIEQISRAQLLDDSFNLGRAGLIDQTIFLNISNYLLNEKSPLPFRAAFYGLDFISDIISSDSNANDMFTAFFTKLIEKHYAKFGWNLTLDNSNEIDLQLIVIRTMCKFGNIDCIQQSRKLYSNWLNLNQSLPSNFKNVIYQTISAFGDRQEWYQLYNIALKETNEAEKLRILRALTFSKDYELLNFLLRKSREESVVKKQDEATIISDIASNKIGRMLAFDYLDSQWDYFLDRYGVAAFTLPNLVLRVLGKVNTAFGLEKVRRFKHDHPTLGIAMNAYDEVLETVGINVDWLNKNLNLITNWLNYNQMHT